MRIKLDGAQAAIERARAHAVAIGVPMNIAVVDGGGHLVAFARMDGAILGSIEIALAKAKTSVLFDAPSEKLWEFCGPGGPAPATEHTNGGLIPYAGGLPLYDGDATLIGKRAAVTTDAPLPVFERLGLPDTDLSRDAYACAQRATPDFVLFHSVRSYVFARAHARQQGLRAGTDYDDELLFLSCVLHDIGLSEEGNGDQRFEVDGADTAAAFLRERGVEERRIAIAWDAIALHTSEGIAGRKGPEVRLAQEGIGTDILGVRRESLPAGLADEVHAVLPRMDLAYALSDAIVAQATAKPQKATPLTFPGAVLRHHLPYGAQPTWYDLIAMAGWGDRPVGAVARRRARTPEQVGAMFTEYLAAGDIEGLLSLYEPHAHFVPTPGTHLVGTEAIRKALRQLIDSGARLELELREIRQVDGIALVSNTATLTGAGPEPVISTTTEILRRQPDGGWVHIVDDPFFT
ncbi:heme-binding protein [Kitasatospora sp. NPDC059146]|uniref:heme-binding protein n=1 Tax=unclassified Kitasatospora TaxID=2633591 RepID=UPI0036898815